MIENLKVTKYNDGTTIPKAIENNDWVNLQTGAYCNYLNDDGNVVNYGRLYNWYAVNTGKLAPAGWHVATEKDWETLLNYLKASGYNYDETTTNNSNSSKFTVHAGGYRDVDYSFLNIGITGYWWSADEGDSRAGFSHTLSFGNSLGHFTRERNKKEGMSIRCVRN
jgi:uncharacterized protein (TIGR02145 family)